MSEHATPASIRAFVVTVDAEHLDLASDRLWQLGVRAVEERAPADGGPGIELWTSVGQDDAAIGRAAARLDPGWAWRVVDTPTTFAQTWREHVGPSRVDDDLVIVPEWIAIDPGPGITQVIIEPGGAFGLGDHPTSQLSARALRSEIRRRADCGDHSISVLDIGCGTGVLSIVAALTGASSVRAIDIAADAVAATAANAARNGVAERIEVDGQPVHAVEGTYDVVVANILGPVLVASAADLVRLVGSDGTLIISGILAHAHEHVVTALAPLQVVGTATQEGWAAVVLRPEGHGMSDTSDRLASP